MMSYSAATSAPLLPTIALELYIITFHGGRESHTSLLGFTRIIITSLQRHDDHAQWPTQAFCSRQALLHTLATEL